MRSDPAAAPPSRLRFYTVVTLPAAVLMALEMVSSRLLAPHFGNSVYVWGSIIGVFLATMSAGYWLGGRLADRRPDLVTLGGLLLASGAFQAAVLLFGRPATAALGDLTGGTPSGVLLATALLFGPPTVFLAMVSPFAVKIATADLGELGGTAGHLYALSTAGSLAGTLGATFFLIPRMALEPILSSLLAGTVVAALLSIGPAWRRERLLLGFGAALLALVFVPQDLFRQTDVRVVAERLSPYQTLRVVEAGDLRYLYSDGALHAIVDHRDGSNEMVYARVAAAGLLLQPDTRRVAVLGMGGGNVGRHLATIVPGLEIDYVDVDPAVPEIAEQHLAFRPGANHRTHVADARRFLVDRPDERWDYVYIDTYIGHSIPFHLSTVEFFAEVKRHLAPGGVVGVNIIGDLGDPLPRSLLRGLGTTFRHAYVFRVPGGNHLFLATDAGERQDLEDFVGTASGLDWGEGVELGPVELARLFRPTDLDVSDALLLTDRYAPVNDLLDHSVERLPGGDPEPTEADDGSAKLP